jgi:hypothetical protein
MKALLSTTLLLSAVTLVAVILATAPGSAADAAIPRDFVPPLERSFAPNRLDIYDMRREFAREAEHDRIRTRLGDPIRWCRPAGRNEDFGTAYPGPSGLLIVCR